MPRYKIQVDELRRVRREYVVEAADEGEAQELAEAGETWAESDCGRADVVERCIVHGTLVMVPQHTPPIRLACLHCDTNECDGVNEIPSNWCDVQEVQGLVEACEPVADDDASRSPFDWFTHLGVCPDCQLPRPDPTGGESTTTPHEPCPDTKSNKTNSVP